MMALSRRERAVSGVVHHRVRRRREEVLYGEQRECTATPNLTEGLHEARYVWATCNNPALCPHYGEVTHYVNVPNQAAIF